MLAKYVLALLQNGADTPAPDLVTSLVSQLREFLDERACVRVQRTSDWSLPRPLAAKDLTPAHVLVNRHGGVCHGPDDTSGGHSTHAWPGQRGD